MYVVQIIRVFLADPCGLFSRHGVGAPKVDGFALVTKHGDQAAISTYLKPLDMFARHHVETSSITCCMKEILRSR